MLDLLLIVPLTYEVRLVAAAVLDAAAPDTIHGWVIATGGRGTIDMLWSCLSTIFLCVWTVIHLEASISGEMMRGYGAGRKLRALMVLLAPGMLVIYALRIFLRLKRTFYS